jgi:hypothetical protein
LENPEVVAGKDTDVRMPAGTAGRSTVNAIEERMA